MQECISCQGKRRDGKGEGVDIGREGREEGGEEREGRKEGRGKKGEEREGRKGEWRGKG